MKRLFILMLIACSSNFILSWNPVSDDTKRTAKEFAIKHSKVISVVTGGAMILLYVAYSVLNPSGPKPELKIDDFFPVNR